MKKLLSIIIPAYNSEQFLDKCVCSLLEPDCLPELEIIVVNDGSGDATPEIARKYTQRYPDSVRLICQENKGHGGALNAGCAAATGKYLKVIDADDWVETQNLPAFLEFLRTTDTDVVLTHYHTHDISTGEVKNWRTYPEAFGRAYTFGQIMEQWKSFDRGLTFHGITYRTAFYQENGIRLSEHVFYEDNEFATFPCCLAKSVTPLDLFIYDYRIGDVQQSVSDENQLKRIGHTETVMQRMIEEYRRLPLTDSDPGREYVRRKAQGVLLSYETTVMLVEKDRTSGRKKGKAMMEQFRQAFPESGAAVQKQYQMYQIMNYLHVSKASFEKLLRSKLYNKLRHNHNFG